LAQVYSTSGCFTVDQTFSTFSTAGSSYTPGSPPQSPPPGIPGLTDIFLRVQSGGTVAGDPFTVRFTSPPDDIVATGNFENTGAGTGTVTSVFSFSISGAAAGGGNWAANHLIWSLGNVHVQGGNSGAVDGSLQICYGQTTIVGCPNLLTFTLTPITTDTALVTVDTGILLNPNSVIAIQQTINFQKGNAGGGNVVSVGFVDLSFNQVIVTPEPGTVGLLGFGLIGLALLRRRSGSKK
jgi:hypothetical protein